MKVSAVVVTYNRKEMLVDCVKKILSQSLSVTTLYIIDNASTDGTLDELESQGLLSDNRVEYCNTGANLGGAGGFHYGLEKARSDDSDWVWIMDDDVMPEDDALKELVDHGNDTVSYLASCVYGMKGEAMNVPIVNTKNSTSGYPDWYFKLNDKMVEITSATFVSLLINKKAIMRCGLPCKDYFIWGDDTEYTLRITKHFGPAYLVGSSKVIHKRKIVHSLRIEKEDNITRINNAFYLFRNRLINSKIYKSRSDHLKNIIHTVGLGLYVITCRPYGIKKSAVVFKALFSFVYSCKSFNRYIKEQMSIK